MAIQKLAIVGTGGLARELHQLVEDINAVRESFDFLGWLDANTALHHTKVHDALVHGDIGWLADHPDVHVVVGIGAPALRRKVVERIKGLGHTKFATLIHPSAVIGNRIQMGEGVVICAGVVATTDLMIGNHVLINIVATVAHEDVVGDYVTIAPGANVSGNVTIGEGTDIGTNATIIQGIEIGSWSIVGAGAVVAKPLPANVTAVGAPAKPIKERAVNWHLE
ncbi:acetyltransferase [Deinococcus ruber]|uniref:Transferase n=1 Tax=Deinococcus ruber TaxID=1848197 RepID=A0A918KVZ5_9DEIO|nr:acetyltransferase [Deinococcus ruber]GGR36075.1 transferase [Deinococcus ruber]